MLNFIRMKRGIVVAHLLLILSMLASMGTADFRASGPIVMSNSEIMATGVTYSFSFTFTNRIPSRGKLVLRFPHDFASFSVTGCKALSGFSVSNGSSLSCSYTSSVRILTITSAFPSAIGNFISFEVQGITNPLYAATTQAFEVDSYQLSGSDYEALEASVAGITITPTAGAISSESLSLATATVPTTVGAYQELQVKFQAAHAIPTNGYVEIEFPKWNGQYSESFVATATSPGVVDCTALDALATLVTTSDKSLNCIYTQGGFDNFGVALPDKLEVTLNGKLANPIAANIQMSFKVNGVRAPPSTKPVTGFKISTYIYNSKQDSSGVTYQSADVIDQSASTTSFSLLATQAAEGTSASLEVTSSDPSINKQNMMTLRIVVSIPLKAESNIQIVLPADFGFDSLTKVGTIGGHLDASPTWNFNKVTRTLSIDKINLLYVASRESLYITLDSIKNPGQTTPTASFEYYLLDPQNFNVEFSNKGMIFTAAAGGFRSVSVRAEEKLINKVFVDYTFFMGPSDLFNGNAVLKIVAPAQVFVDDGASVQFGSPDIVTVIGCTTEVQFNRVMYVRHAFTNGLLAIQDFYVTISGFTNPSTIQPTESFQASILYEEPTGWYEINVYNGNRMTVTAEPSTALTMDISMTQKMTGQSQTQFIISGSLERYNPIEKQSYLKIGIPGGFIIENTDRVASTCTRLTGFSDEITCSFEKQSSSSASNFGTIMFVRGGFDSETFTTGEFSFSIAEIKNPMTTKPTDDFSMEVYDRYDGLMYTASNEVNMVSNPSPFAFVHVVSLKPINGEKSVYQVTVTLGVETSQGAYLEFTIPDEIKFEDKTGATICRGKQNLAERLSCVYVSENTRRINLVSDNPFENSAHPSGTTVQFEIGYLRNPISLRSTGYFYVSSYTHFGSKKYLINESKRQVYCQNSEPGNIEINQAYTTDSELNSETELRISFETQSPIPSDSTLSMTLPANLAIESGAIQMYINENLVSPSISIAAKQFTVRGIPVDEQTIFTVRFVGGLINPGEGPYSFEYLKIEFADSSDYSIDKRVLNQVYVDVNCTNNCDTCVDTLSKCTSCKFKAAQDETLFLKADEFKCVTDCGPGQFQDAGYKCSRCGGECLLCTVSATSCLLCNPNGPTPYADPNSLLCYKECPETTYLDKASTLCTPCKLPCSTCSSPDVCNNCNKVDPTNLDIFFFEQEKKCYQECPPISVPNPGKNCTICESPCETCNGLPSQCVTCIEGTYLHKNNECINSCPFLYFENHEERMCQYFGELQLPVPFSIIAFVITVGVGISSFVKGADKNGREQQGTAFFMTMLAFVDLLLRLNWAVLAYVVYQKDFYITFGVLLGLLVMSSFMNIALFRRFFYSKYKYEYEDPLFSEYCAKNPATSHIIILLGYIFSFQMVRLTYSRFLAKKQFRAQFSRRLKFFRLIGRLTVLETLLLYAPAVGINSYSLTYITDQKTTQFWLNVDSLALVCYAVILIAVVLTQREKLMNHASYFKFSELFKFGDDTDAETLTGETVNTVNTYQSQQNDIKGGDKRQVYGNEGLHYGDSDGDKASVVSLPCLDQLQFNSAAAMEDLQKQKLYQVEQLEFFNANSNSNPSNLMKQMQVSGSRTGGGSRNSSKVVYGTNSGYEGQGQNRPMSGFSASRHNAARFNADIEEAEMKKRSRQNNPNANGSRNVSAIDGQEYRKLEDKRDRINLKKKLYEKKKIEDEEQVVILNDELQKFENEKLGLNDRLIELQMQLAELKGEVKHVDKARRRKVLALEQAKRRDIIRRQGREVPYQSHSGLTSQSRSRSALTKSNNNTQMSKSPRGAAANSRPMRKKRGNQEGLQQKKSGHNSEISLSVTAEQRSANQNLQNSDQNVIQFSPDTFQPTAQGEEDRAVATRELHAVIELQVETEKGDLRKPFVDRVGEDDTEQGDLGYPRVERDSDDDTVKGDPGYPKVDRSNELDDYDTFFSNKGVPPIERNSDAATVEGEPGYPRLGIQDTEPADQMARPVDTLNTNEVDDRLDGIQDTEVADQMARPVDTLNTNEVDGRVDGIQDTEVADQLARPVDTLNTNEVDGRVDDAALEENDNFTSPDLNISPIPARRKAQNETDVVDLDDFDLEDW